MSRSSLLALCFTLYTTALHFSHGHFQMESFILIVFCILMGLFTLTFRLSDEFNPQIWTMGILLHSLLFFTHHGILYTQNTEALDLILNLRNLSLVLAFLVIWPKLNEKASLFVIGSLISIFCISKYAVIMASPHPSIDVYYVMTAGTDGFLRGENPYSLEYSSSMSQAYGYQTTFSYLPSILYLTAPLRLLGLDARVLLWLAELLIALGIFKVTHKRLKTFKNAALPALLFLSAPVNWFLLEQAWSDTLMISVLFWGWIFIQDRRPLLGAITLAIAAGIKQYAVFICILIAIDAYRMMSKREFMRALLTAILTLIAIIAPFILINPQAFSQSVLGLYQNMPLRLDSMSITTILARFMPPESVPDIAKHSWVLAVFFFVSLLVGKSWLTRSFVFLSLTFILGSHAFCNQHHLLATSLLLMGTTSPLSEEGATRTIPWIPLGVLIFLVSRCFILFGYAPYITDVALYSEQALQASQGLRAYTDFFYPYPPFSLPFIYLPEWLGATEFFSYRNLFNKIFFIIDLGLTFLIVRTAKQKLKFSDSMIFSSLLLLSLFGLLQGHLLYDRIDLGVTFFNFLLFMLTLSGMSWGWTALVSNIGVLYKFIPFFPAVFLHLIQHAELKLSSFIIRSAMMLLPALFIIAIFEYTSHPGIIRYLFEHQERGIQIESLWATPYLLAQIWSGNNTVAIDTVFGGQHLKSEAISPVILFLSKSLGFLALAVFGIWNFRRKPKVSHELLLLTPLCVLLIFMSTQRVLSPQFFIWLIPFLSLCIVKFKSRSLLFLSLCLYTLTFIGFDLGYWSFVKFHPFFVHVVALRNLVLLILTLAVLRLFRSKQARVV